MAEIKPFTALNKITGTISEGMMLKVRVIRVWNLINNKNKTQIYSTEFIVIDEQGTRMAGNCYYKDSRKFTPVLKEKKCLIITNPRIVGTNIAFRYSDIQWKLRLEYDTNVSFCEDFGGTLYGFEFTDLESIIMMTASMTQSLDLIGLMTGYKDKELIRTKTGVDTSRMLIYLEDLKGKKIYVTLWGDHAEELSGYLSDPKNVDRVVLIIQFAKYKEHKGTYSLGNARLFINSDIPEILAFKESFFKDPKRASISPSSNTSKPRLWKSDEDDFLVSTEFFSFGDVGKMSEAKNVIILGTIHGIRTNSNWHYEGCSFCGFGVKKFVKCGKVSDTGASEITDSYYECSNVNCRGETITAVPKWRIPIEVEDDNGFLLSLTMFNPLAKRILNLDVAKVVEKFHQAEVTHAYPPELDVLIGKRYAFKIEITKCNLMNNCFTYTIVKLSSDPKIISKLETKRNLIQNSQISSVNQESMTRYEDQPNVTMSLEDSIADNETPHNTARKGIKRKLFLVDEIDEEADARGGSNEEGKNDVEDVQNDAAYSSTKAHGDNEKGKEII